MARFRASCYADHQIAAAFEMHFEECGSIERTMPWPVKLYTVPMKMHICTSREFELYYPVAYVFSCGAAKAARPFFLHTPSLTTGILTSPCLGPASVDGARLRSQS
jgi:hypothetical protein